MHLDLTRDKATQFPPVADLARVTSARVWHCNYVSLAPLARLLNLEALAIATYPDDSFAPLNGLTRLRYLSIIHFPNAADLSPLATLEKLETLSLSSLPSWDAAGRVLSVASLEPIARMAKLKHIELFGVRPESKGLAPLLELKGLRTARLSKFSEIETAHFFSASGASDEFAPRPAFAAA